jgi:hypothetical protein
MNTHIQERCTISVLTPFRTMELRHRVRGEFTGMPGLRLTLEQAMRLWSFDRPTCVEVLTQLRSAKFLELDPTGRYRLARGGY